MPRESQSKIVSRAGSKLTSPLSDYMTYTNLSDKRCLPCGYLCQNGELILPTEKLPDGMRVERWVTLFDFDIELAIFDHSGLRGANWFELNETQKDRLRNLITEKRKQQGNRR